MCSVKRHIKVVSGVYTQEIMSMQSAQPTTLKNNCLSKLNKTTVNIVWRFTRLPCAAKRKHRKFYNFFFSFFEDSFVFRLLQKKSSFLAGVVSEIFALELFCLFFCKNVLQKENV